MQVATIDERDDVEEIMLDLEAETYLLELIMKYGRFIDVSNDARERALDNITGYQRQHLQDIFRYYNNEQLIVPTSYLVSELRLSMEQEGVA